MNVRPLIVPGLFFGASAVTGNVWWIVVCLILLAVTSVLETFAEVKKPRNGR